MEIPFLALKITNKKYEAEFKLAFEKLLNSGWYLLGEELNSFEKEYANFSDVKYCHGLANGLDALILSLKVLNIGKNDEVIVPSNTYIASWLAVSYVGALPIPVEPKMNTYNIDPSKIEEKINSRTKAIMPVHLYGQACEMVEIMHIAKKYNLYVIEDNAQSQGAMCDSQLTGSFGDCNATSFYPGKNLGALGDGGAITTNNEVIAHQIKLLRNYGSEIKYYHEIKGVNSRLDDIQAAFLSIKLKFLKGENDKRQKLAMVYHQLLKDTGDIVLPVVAESCTSVYHLYIIRTKLRDQLQEYLKKNDIGTMIHYPIPPHLQNAYKDLDYKKGSFPIAEEIANSCLSLPLNTALTETEVHFICSKIKQFYN